jgi:hypothetical protein
LIQKVLAAAVAVILALTGMVTGLKWLTILALLLWIAAMLYFGLGSRQSDPTSNEESKHGRTG